MKKSKKRVGTRTGTRTGKDRRTGRMQPGRRGAFSVGAVHPVRVIVEQRERKQWEPEQARERESYGSNGSAQAYSRVMV